MKKILIIIFTLFIGFNLFADEVDQAISAAINFTDGKPSEPLKLLENYSVESINNPERRDLIEIKSDRVQTTEYGTLLLNYVVQQLLADLS